MKRAERWLVGALVFTALDSGYLTWRYLALRLALVRPGTSICSWTPFIDCDRVLLAPQANAFFVPNALLGFAFYLGCLIWWRAGTRLGAAYRFHVIRTLTFWLAVASLFTLRFFWLLVHLPNFCPICPLNHFATYGALAASFVLFRRTAHEATRIRWRPLIVLVAVCVGLFTLLQLVWFVAQANGVLTGAPPAGGPGPQRLSSRKSHSARDT